MERALTRYIRALRTAGATVSPAEAIDAARAVAIVGYDDRGALKDTLSVVLTKTEEEKATHDRLFDLFFSRADPRDEAADGEGTPADGAAEPGEDGGGTGEDGGESPAGDEVEALVGLAKSGGSRLDAALERAADAAGADDIRFASQGTYFSRRMLEAMGIEALETRLMERLQTRTEAAQAEAQALMDARAALDRRARALVRERFEVFGRAATETFMNQAIATRRIDKLEIRDMERMKAVVARMARRLAVRHARRRKSPRRGQLDIRRTLRANAGYDGVPFEMVFRRKRRNRPKIVAICDVSGSVANYVRFLLMFLYALNETVSDLSAFAFSAELADVGDILRRLPFEAAFDHILLNLGAGATDYGQALVELRERHFEVIDRRTTVLILGDGRSNHSDPRADILAEIADRAKRVVWLCPEPPGRWGRGDSEIPRYRPFCAPLRYCATAMDLEDTLDDILLAYD